MKYWKRTAMICIVALLPWAAGAQSHGPKHDMDPEKASARMTEKLTERLQLTEDQQGDVQRILRESIVQRQDVRKTSTSREEAMPRMREIQQDTDDQLKQVLTKEQFTEYMEARKEMRERQRDRREKHRQGGERD